ncbi:MAG TPA: hypothetical protein VFE34_14175 [Dongiaceae bacterium]|nr:hypothetical protein [Dongiaceae bacterium]
MAVTAAIAATMTAPVPAAMATAVAAAMATAVAIACEGWLLKIEDCQSNWRDRCDQAGSEKCPN